MPAKKELSNNEHNDLIFKKIAKLEGEIKSLKDDLKTVEKVQYATLAECNAMVKKAREQAKNTEPKGE